jgi:hypothetical protein
MGDLEKAIVPCLVAAALDCPVRWAETMGDYEGRDRTIEVFGIDAELQLGALRALRPIMPGLEEAAGGPIVVIFHTVAETKRLYPEMEKTDG